MEGRRRRYSARLYLVIGVIVGALALWIHSNLLLLATVTSFGAYLGTQAFYVSQGAKIDELESLLRRYASSDDETLMALSQKAEMSTKRD